MKKRIASLLCLVLLVSILLAGCAPATIEGKWKGEFDLAAALNTALAATEGYDTTGFQFENISLPITMEFTAEGECTLSFADAAVETMISAVIDQLLPFLEEQFANMGMSMDDLLALSGMSKDEFMQQMAGGLTDSIDLSALNRTSKYWAEDGLLYIGETKEEAEGVPYTLEGNKLIIQAGDDAPEAAQFLFPLTLERVK